MRAHRVRPARFQIFHLATVRPCDLGKTCFPGSQASSLWNGDRGTWQQPLGGPQGAEGTLSREMQREPREGSCCFPGAEAVQEPETQKGPLLGATAGHRARAGRRGERHADLSLQASDVPLTYQTSPGKVACKSPASRAQKEEQRGDLEGKTSSQPQQRDSSTGSGKGLGPGAGLPPPSAHLLSSLSTSLSFWREHCLPLCSSVPSSLR